MIWQIFYVGALLSFKKMSPKPSTQSGGQTHGWILPIFVVYSHQIDLILCRRSCFHRVWFPLSSNHRRKVCRLIITFFTQYILIKVSHSHFEPKWKIWCDSSFWCLSSGKWSSLPNLNPGRLPLAWKNH